MQGENLPSTAETCKIGENRITVKFDDRCAHALKSPLILREVFDNRKDLVMPPLSLQASNSTNTVAALVDHVWRRFDMEGLAQGPYSSKVLLQKCLFKIRYSAVLRVCYGADPIVIFKAPYDLHHTGFQHP